LEEAIAAWVLVYLLLH